MNVITAKKWSVIFILVSLLISFIIITLLGKSLNSFYNYQKFDSELHGSVSGKMELTLDRFHFFLRNELKKEWLQLKASKPVSDSDSPLKTFHISVRQADIDLLNSNLPMSGKEQYIDGSLKISDDGSNKIHDIKIRYRGDNNFHWLYPQKSMRIKFKGKNSYHMEKSFNLVNPPNLYFHRDIITYSLARQLGLLAPDNYPVRVFINGVYKGVFCYLSQVNERLLRKHKMMPGSIYFGDSAPINERGVRNLWSNEKFWEKKAHRNAEQEKNREDIVFFINAVYEPDEKKFYDMFNQFFDTEKFFKYVAIDRFVGSYHHDYHHNHKLYFDPYKGKFEPIEWDVRVWTMPEEKDTALYPLLLKLKKNPILDAKIDKKVYSLIESKMNKYFIQQIDALYDQVKYDLKSDYLKDNAVLNKLFITWISEPFMMDDYDKQIQSDKQLINTRIENLKKIYDTVSIRYDATSYGHDKFILKIMLSGYSPVILNFNPDISISRKNRGEVENDSFSSITLYPGRKLEKNIRKINVQLMGRDNVVNVPQFYEFVVATDNITAFINTLEATNYITGKPVKMKPEKFKIQYDKEVIHPWDLITPEDRVLELKGVINLSGTKVFKENEHVIIKPGTLFLMDEKASVLFHGKVTAQGSKKNPIRFIAKDPKIPWGIVALQGKGTKNSKFEYVEFENGSVDTQNLIHYTAPFNIHDTDWFEVRHCRIGQNFVGDDSMHIAHAKGIIDNCEFHDAKSDALDIDISEVLVTNNIFYKSGNDGLDIMTTTLDASNNVFIDTGDKGISVGEWSKANITDSLFLRAQIGIAIKDKSRVTAENIVIADSKILAIHLYNKNKQYDEGGFFNGNHIYLLGNTKVKTDKRSRKKMINKTENELPSLKNNQWYSNLLKNVNEEIVDDMELKYAR